MKAVRSFTERSARTSISPEGGYNIPNGGDSCLTVSYRRASRVTVEYSVIGILNKLLITSVKTTRAFPLLYKLVDIIIRIEINEIKTSIS